MNRTEVYFLLAIALSYHMFGSALLYLYWCAYSLGKYRGLHDV